MGLWARVKHGKNRSKNVPNVILRPLEYLDELCLSTTLKIRDVYNYIHLVSVLKKDIERIEQFIHITRVHTG